MTEPTDYDLEQDDRVSGLQNDLGLRDDSKRLPQGHQGPPEQGRSTDWDRYQDSRLDALDEFILDPNEVAANPAAQEASASQRLRIHVPNVKTTLSLGAKAPGGSIREADTGAPNFDGFGVDTLGHVFVDARKDAASSKIRIQALGDITLQTPETFASGGQKGALVASNCGAVLAGGGGTVIFGGAGLPWSDNQQADASTPDTPAWITNVANSASNWSTWWAGLDAAIAASAVVASRSDMKINKATFGSLSNITAAAAAYGGAVGGAISAYGFVNGLGAPIPAIGGTTIHGTTGLILGSGATAGLYSTLGTCIGSLLSVGVLAPAASVTGLVSAELKGGKTEVKGWTDLSLVGGHTTEIAARGGPGFLLAKASKMVFGDLAPSDASQAATTNIHLLAKEGVTIETKSGGAHRSPVHTPGITIDTHGHLDVKAAEKVTIESTEKAIELLLDQHNSLLMEMGKTRLLVNDTQVILEKGKGVTVQQTEDGGAYIKKDRIALAYGGNHLVVKKSGQHTFKGSKINIKASTINLG